MRINPDKLNKLAHTVADTLADLEEVGFLEDRNTIRQEAQGANGAAHRRGQDRHGGATEDRQSAQDHHGRLAGVGDSVPQVLQRRGTEAWDLTAGSGPESIFAECRIFVKVKVRPETAPAQSVALSSRG